MQSLPSAFQHTACRQGTVRTGNLTFDCGNQKCANGYYASLFQHISFNSIF